MSTALTLFKLHEEKDIEALLPEQKQADTETDKRRLLCAACAHPVTDPGHRIARNGAHQHEFTNPHGVVYRIGCFDAAPGCIQVGPASNQWTWFPGFAWRIALCGQCQNHLGWEYRSTGEGFFGLILDRLTLAQ